MNHTGIGSRKEKEKNVAYVNQSERRKKIKIVKIYKSVQVYRIL